jgi:alpha-L-fucosidase 2
MKTLKSCGIATAVIAGLTLPLANLQADPINWPERIASNGLTWDKIDTDFYNGAFIGDGIQGAMIMRDEKNPDGIRMLLGHYKAITHYTVHKWEYCQSRVYAGNIIVDPAGTAAQQTMSMDIFNGEVNGTIKTDKGNLAWNVFDDRELLVFVATVEGEGGENSAKLAVREEWAISPRYYLENKNLEEYTEHLPPKPELSKQGPIELVINRAKTRGVHVVASQLVNQNGRQILYVAIGVDDNRDMNKAQELATADAVRRIQTAVSEGVDTLRKRNRAWWNNYMLKGRLAIDEDPYWEKFWWLQIYKFGCTSSETSDFIIDTQGVWIWETAWAGVWWNLNAQLSYFPMFSGNRLDAGKSLINGLDRKYKSGALAKNAGGVGISLGRSSTYEGYAGWGSEYGNLPWALHCYWKYWQYSGNDEIGKNLFPMLKDNAKYLKTRLIKEDDGKYHMEPSRSPEYEDEHLLKNANYGLMSVHWVNKTLLDMNEYFGFNDPMADEWQEVLDNLLPFPENENGFMVSSEQGFDKGHRHYSHLLAIYPYHTVTPDSDDLELVKKSVDRWLTLTEIGGHAGYTYTGGCAMLAMLGDGDNALRLMEKLKTDKVKPNTMYAEGGGPVIETPLSAVESINYLLLQSWGGVIQVFPAVPSSWKNVSFQKLRTEGAFLVSARLVDGSFNSFEIHSEQGKTCTLKNPWSGKKVWVYNEAGKPVRTKQKGDLLIFPTQAGQTYRVGFKK